MLACLHCLWPPCPRPVQHLESCTRGASTTMVVWATSPTRTSCGQDKWMHCVGCVFSRCCSPPLPSCLPPPPSTPHTRLLPPRAHIATPSTSLPMCAWCVERAQARVTTSAFHASSRTHHTSSTLDCLTHVSFPRLEQHPTFPTPHPRCRLNAASTQR
jgi:hypothetical protein